VPPLSMTFCAIREAKLKPLAIEAEFMSFYTDSAVLQISSGVTILLELFCSSLLCSFDISGKTARSTLFK
jgi:hypothetical protein